MSVWCIYVHTLKVDGRKYVGQTKTTMERRWAAHVRSVHKTFDGGSAFTSAIRKYGQDAFLHEALEYVNNQWDADKAEGKWIAAYNTTDPSFGFNSQSRTRSVFRMRETARDEGDVVDDMQDWLTDLSTGPGAVVYEADTKMVRYIDNREAWLARPMDHEATTGAKRKRRVAR